MSNDSTQDKGSSATPKLAGFLGIKVGTLYSMGPTSRRIPFYRFVRSMLRFRREDLERWLARPCRRAGAVTHGHHQAWTRSHQHSLAALQALVEARPVMREGDVGRARMLYVLAGFNFERDDTRRGWWTS